MLNRKPQPIPEIWPGSTVYILGGGPSLSKEDLSTIHDKRVIGVNQAFRLGNFVDILYFGDGEFYRQNFRTGLKQFGGPIFTSYGSVPEKGWSKILRVKRSRDNPHGIESKHRNSISWNNCSGASAINLAYWLGAERIILIGFDNGPEGAKHNWHELYGRRGAKFNPYFGHSLGWNRIALHAKELGLEIINTSKGSAIKQIPYCALKDLV